MFADAGEAGGKMWTGPGYGGYAPLSHPMMPQTMVRTYRSAREYEDDAAQLAPHGWRPLSVTPVRQAPNQSAGCLSGCGSCLLAPIMLPVALITAVFSLGRVNLAAHPGDHLSVVYAWAPPAVAVSPQQYAQLTGWYAPELPEPHPVRALFEALIRPWITPDDPDDPDDPQGAASDARRVVGLTSGEWRYVLVVGTILGLLLLGFIFLLMHAGS